MTGSTLRARTANSTYEIEHTESGIRVRRLDGVRPPTPQFGEDLAWGDLLSYDVFGDGLIFFWAEPLGRVTVTSPVRSVEVTS